MMFGILTLPVFVVAIAATYALWRAKHSRRRLNVRRFVLTSVICHVVLIPPMALATLLAHQWSNPTDDWGDIVVFGSVLVLLLATPCVAVPVWWIGSRVERGRQARYPSACASCGYDLTGVPGNICPECGPPQESVRQLEGM